MKNNREMFIPSNAQAVESLGADVAIYTFTNPAGAPCALAFLGRQQRPAWRYRFADVTERKSHIDAEIFKRLEHLARQAERNKAHQLSAGDILYSSWGYEQTNINFYQITRVVSGKTVELGEIEQTKTEAKIGMQGTCEPIADHFKPGGQVKQRRVNGEFNTVKVSDSQTAQPYKGVPLNYSSYH